MSNEEQGHVPQRSFWSSSERAERWQQDVGRRRQDLAAATQRMLEAAGLKPGDRVLDLAAGTGDQSLLAARLVGPGGSILTTDSSADMLGIAARVAAGQSRT
jgi:ubiquinone/menaquinone biosynthesis C-methylase UbiE